MYTGINLKLEEAQQGVFHLRKIDSMMKELISQEKYERLYTQKKELLMKSSEQTAQIILDLNEQISFSKNNLNEIKEAISAGREVVNCLDNALNSLDSAEGWGVWDMLGGGLISNIAKHSNIDDAKCEVERTQTLLRRFKTELSDKINDFISMA